MPIYAYRCSSCGGAKDVLQKMSDSVLTECPFCGAPTFVKQVTAAGFQLKGSGWYVTDFRGDSKAPPKPAEGAVAGPAEAPKKGAAAAEGGAAAPATSKAEGAPAASPAPAASAPAPTSGGSTPAGSK